jgi:hypothetical protein
MSLDLDEVEALLVNRLLQEPHLAKYINTDSTTKTKQNVFCIRAQFGACMALNRSDVHVRHEVRKQDNLARLWAVADDGPDAPPRLVLAYNHHAHDLRPFVTVVDDGNWTSIPMCVALYPHLFEDLWQDAEQRRAIAVEL